MVDGRRRNRLAKWKGVRPGLALGLLLCLGVTMYVSQYIMHRKAILQEKRYHLEQTVVQLQDELSHTKREADALRDRAQRQESGARVDDSAKDGAKKPKPSKRRWGTPHVASSEQLHNASAGHYDRFDRPPFVQSANNVSWSRPAFSQRTASKALGGTIPNDNENEKKRLQVRKAMQHAWGGYKQYAYGQDELEPVTRSGVNDFGHLGATAIDAIDTLWIMGLKDEYEEARAVVAQFRENLLDASPLSTFECTIRVLGGFLSVYYLTGDKLFLDNARELGDRLLSAYNTTSGFPSGWISLQTLNHHDAKWLRGGKVLAEVGTSQLEFYALSRETGDMKYAMAAARPLKRLHEMYKHSPLLPTNFHDSGKFAMPLFTLGSMADSYYEYLLKCWVQAGNRSEEMVLNTGRRWEAAMDAAIKYLVINEGGPLTALVDLQGNFNQSAEMSPVKASPGLSSPGANYNLEMSHLSCFAPGMFALGAHKWQGLLSRKKRARYLRVAEDLTHTCYMMYHTTRTGLSGESYRIIMDKLVPVDRRNMLRPEVVESLMILHRVTGKQKYRDWGWEIFQSIEKHCKVTAGYSGVLDVNDDQAELDNRMQSWFLAETLKYLFLLFSPKDVISLDQWVFNTEAHPLMIWQ